MKMKTLKLGATGKFPEGQVNEHDEGELRLGIAVDYQQAIIHIAFGKKVTWIGLPSQSAREFARLILEKADELDKRRT